MAFTLKINGTPHEVDVDGDTPLLWVLRDVLGMTGTKFICHKPALCAGLDAAARIDQGEKHRSPTRNLPEPFALCGTGAKEFPILLLDARAPARFRGEQEPIDPVAGHIPGAANRYNAENIASDGTFKSAAQLRQEFAALLAGRAPAEVVHYCGSGVAACHNLLAMEIAGLPGGKLYAGSWSEWSADPKRRIAR